MRFSISVVEEESGCALTVRVPWFGIVGLSYPSLTAGSLRGCLFLSTPKTQMQWFSLSKEKSETSQGPCVMRREDRVKGRSTGGEASFKKPPRDHRPELCWEMQEAIQEEERISEETKINTLEDCLHICLQTVPHIISVSCVHSFMHVCYHTCTHKDC